MSDDYDWLTDPVTANMRFNEAYADATDYRAQAILAQEEADSNRAEQRRQWMAARPHSYRPYELIPGFCACGYREDHQIHTRKEDK